MIFDGDTVEEKNLSRQAFDEEDIGQNKAVAMAGILNAAFDLKWRSIPAYVTDASQITNQIGSSRLTIPVIIGCVDNHGCRLLLEKLFDSLENVVYLDSANEFHAGESVFAYKIEGAVVSPYRSVYFPEILTADRRNREEMSCEELNNVAPQHIITNMLAGQVLFAEACAVLDKTPHPGLVTFDAGSYVMEYMPAGGAA